MNQSVTVSQNVIYVMQSTTWKRESGRESTEDYYKRRDHELTGQKGEDLKVPIPRSVMTTAVTQEVLDDQSVVSSAEGSRWCERKCSWRPTSESILEAAEAKILQFIKTRYESKYVPIQNQQKIWTLKFNPNATKVPLVLVHGFGGGAGLWAMNIDALAKGRTIYAMDVLGFGRSSRPKISSDPEEAENEFVNSIEQWRHQLGLEKFVLLGHSFGGFLASSYTLKHPSRVQHLVLVDSWGFPEKPPNIENDFPMWAKVLKAVIMPFNPLAALRAAGPWGPSLVQKFRPDFQRKFSRLLTEDDTILNYIYHCNAQKPSGEKAFKKMSASFGWAKFPMIHRISGVDKNIPMTMIHGSESWMDDSTGYKTKSLRSGSFVDVQVIPEAGHHVYADQPDAFNLMIDKICRKEDEKIDVVVN